VGELEVESGLLAQPTDPDKILQRRPEDAGEGVKPDKQGLGQRLNIAARQRPEEQEFQQLVVGKGAGPSLAGSQPQSRSVPGVGRGVRGAIGLT
jgi:hypothetical protein